MQVNLNSEIRAGLSADQALLERALFYGDSLFESILVLGGRIPLLPWHWARLRMGLELLGYVIPENWSIDFFEKEILRLDLGHARVRLTIWRSPGGFYAPEDNTPNFLITAFSLASGLFEWNGPGLTVGLVESVRVPVDVYSGVKTLNAARYVVAAQQARAKGWDEGIILNAYDRVCEGTRSNLFWIKDGEVFTPPLKDGCLTGIMRHLLLALTFEGNLKIQERSCSIADLEMADELFFSNAIRGIMPAQSMGDNTYNNLLTKQIHNTVQRFMLERLSSENGTELLPSFAP